METLHQINNNLIGIVHDDNHKSELLKILVANIRNLRSSTLELVSLLIKIREMCSYNVLGGKYNLDNINKFYMFDKNYLIKMKFDTDFLVNSRLSKYFEFEACEADPFFCYFFFKNPLIENLNKMEISEDLLPLVKHGQYLILQDLIYFNINTIYMKNFKKQEKEKIINGNNIDIYYKII